MWASCLCGFCGIVRQQKAPVEVDREFRPGVLFCNAAHFADGAPEAGKGKDSRACDKRVRSSSSTIHGSLEIDAAVYRDVEGQRLVAPPHEGLLDFRQHLSDKRLAAEAWIHCHDQQ